MVMDNKGVVKAQNKSALERDWECFFEALRAADILAGGCGSEEFKDFTLEKIYKHLYPNKIKLTFQLEEDFTDKTFG